MQRTGVDPAMAELLHSAVHNLKSPAGRLRLLAQMLTRSGATLDEDARGLLKHIEDSAAAVGVVAEGLRSYAEICDRPLEREPLDLGVAAAAAISNLRDEIESAGAQVTHSVLPTVQADRFLMIWLLQELLANALRLHSGAPPRIHISAIPRVPEGWIISVTDNGLGIEADFAERAFRPFKKLSSKGGAGLGLTICRKIMTTHGGDIWAEPRSGGAEIRFLIPDVEAGPGC
jgi:light-regulated signal transduction histidine kinase (bacteriophytochrome)